MAGDDRMKDLHARRARARAMGRPERLARRGHAAARHLVHRVIDPADPREVVIRFPARARPRPAVGRLRVGGGPRSL